MLADRMKALATIDATLTPALDWPYVNFRAGNATGYAIEKGKEMEPTVIVTLEFDSCRITYELGEDSDKEIIGLIQKYGCNVMEHDLPEIIEPLPPS